MASSTIITDYLAKGTHAARPATPSIPSGGISIYYETDTLNTFVYVPSVGWVQINGSSSAGTPPTIVQSGFSTAVSASITLGSAPTSGNLLVAICKSSGSSTAGSGWTNVVTDNGGTNYSMICTKVAGASESTTQTPIGTASPSVASIAMWELHGQAVTPVVYAGDIANASSQYSATPLAPGLTNVLALAAIRTDGTSPQTLGAAQNMTQDSLINTGTTYQVAGHSDGSKAVAQLLTSIGTAVATRAGIILITA